MLQFSVDDCYRNMVVFFSLDDGYLKNCSERSSYYFLLEVPSIFVQGLIGSKEEKGVLFLKGNTSSINPFI